MAARVAVLVRWIFLPPHVQFCLVLAGLLQILHFGNRRVPASSSQLPASFVLLLCCTFMDMVCGRCP